MQDATDADAGIKRVWQRGDFDFILTLKDCTGEREIPFPECDFTLEIYSETGFRSYTAGVCDGVAVNCREDNGRIHVYCDNHGLPLGQLWGRLTLHCPDGEWPDGVRDTGDAFPLGIELVADRASCCKTAAEIELQLPALKGEPMRWKDLTPEQRKELADDVSPGVARMLAGKVAVVRSVTAIERRSEDIYNALNEHETESRIHFPTGAWVWVAVKHTFAKVVKDEATGIKSYDFTCPFAEELCQPGTQGADRRWNTACLYLIDGRLCYIDGGRMRRLPKERPLKPFVTYSTMPYDAEEGTVYINKGFINARPLTGSSMHRVYHWDDLVCQVTGGSKENPGAQIVTLEEINAENEFVVPAEEEGAGAYRIQLLNAENGGYITAKLHLPLSMKNVHKYITVKRLPDGRRAIVGVPEYAVCRGRFEVPEAKHGFPWLVTVKHGEHSLNKPLHTISIDDCFNIDRNRLEIEQWLRRSSSTCQFVRSQLHWDSDGRFYKGNEWRWSKRKYRAVILPKKTGLIRVRVRGTKTMDPSDWIYLCIRFSPASGVLLFPAKMKRT